jgi:2-polyprenyl-3-methyl-5-hydroxy-6-metoxy-1,4-benzoquinol methylase
MTLKRTTRSYQKSWLKKNKHLKILDLGSSLNNFWTEANHFADVDDFEKDFKDLNLKYTQIKPNQKLPFNDKEFDYVILSHVLEHVPNLLDFASELERISKAGYIELPTKLNDNLVFGCDEEDVGHKWWFEFDDINNQLLYTEKADVLEKFITVGQIWKLEKFFEDSLILQIYWEDKINLDRGKPIKFDKKINFLTLVRKYFSKKMRKLLSRKNNN